MGILISDIEELVDSLDTIIWNMDKNHKVFDGKCCFISACIAKELEERSIPFKVVAYTPEGDEHYDINKLAKDGLLRHVSIQILTGKRQIIGDKFIDKSGLHVSFYRLSADELMKIYEDNTWNDGHVDISDEDIRDEIEMTFIMILD